VTGRDRIVIVVVAFVVLIGAAWLEVISPKRDEASKLQSQINSAQSALNGARGVLAQGEAARQAFRQSYTTLVRLGEAVPTDDNVPSLIYQVQSAASKSGVDFLGLTLNPAGATGAPNVSTPASSSTSTTTSTTPPSTTTPTSTIGATSTPTLPPGAVIGPAGFPIEPFTFTFQGNFFHLANFFARLERFVVATGQRLTVSGRLLNLGAISLGPAPKGFPEITATVSATTYLLPASEGLVDGATPAGPAPASSLPASVTTSSSPVPAPAVVTAGGGG
jgi:type II secretory pathway pseudopilin PulG